VLRERFEATRLCSGSVGSRRRLAMLGLRLFGLVRRGTGPLLASDFRRGREGSREGLFWAAAVDVETPECRFRRSEAAEKVESRAVLRLWRRVGSSQGRGMKRPCAVFCSEALKTGEVGGVMSASLESSRSEDRKRA
jgi:hypothetical protein